MENNGQGSAMEGRPTDEFDADDLEADNAMMQTSEGLMSIVRRDCVSPELSTERRRMMEFIPDDTSNLFQPVRTLNFSDTDVTHDDDSITQDEGNQNGGSQFEEVHDEPGSTTTGSNLIDLEWMEEGNENQNMRIIEGHDSSPLEVVRSSVMVSYVGVSQQHMSPSGHGSVMSQSPLPPQSRQDQSLSQTSQQFNQSLVSQTAFSPLKEDMNMSGRGSPTLSDSLDERDAENGQYGGRRPQRDADVHHYPSFSGTGPPMSVGHDYHGNDGMHRNVTVNIPYSSHQQSFDERALVNSNNNKENVSPRVNISPSFTSNISTANQGPRSDQEFDRSQQLQEFDNPEVQVIAGGLATWEDAGNDAENNVHVGSNSLMRCAVVGHSVAPSTRGGRSSDSQPRLASQGMAAPCPRLVRTEQRQATHGLAGQTGTGRGNAGRLTHNRGIPSRGVGRSRPVVQGAGQPRPVVQGSSVADVKKVQKIGTASNASRPNVNDRRGVEPIDRSLDRISGVGSERPQTRAQIGVGVADSRSDSRTPPIHMQTSVTSPRIQAALNNNSPVGHEPVIGCFKVSAGFRQDDDNDDESVVDSVHTHMDAMSSASYKLSPKLNEMSPPSVSVDIQGMEDVRSHLRNMLRLSENTFAERPTFDMGDTASELLMDQAFKRPFSSHIQGDVPDLFESFPNYSSTMFHDLSESAISKPDASFQPDRSYMREALEKERYRRKHCEQQIHHLNIRLLEAQQQLAVAVATDRKKDNMIEQLDKQLAKVVEGWKKREMEKDEYLKLMLREKSQIEQSLHQQQEMINSFESDMAHTIDELKREKENSAQAIESLRQQIDEILREKLHAEEQLDAERERGSLISQEWQQLKEARELAESRAQQLQERLHKEQDEWYKREQDLLSTIDDVKEANLKVIQMEKSRSDEYQSLAADMEERLRETQTQNKKLEMDIDALEREKESIKVEIAIIEAKYETAQRKLEADLHSQMEKEIAEQVAQVQEKMDELTSELQDKHRQQVKEIHQRHQADLEEHMQLFSEDARKKDDDYRQQIQNYEERLKEYRNENTALKHAKQKLESQRMEVLSKLQYMMQSQWNEAVSLLVSTPQRNSQGSQIAAQMNLGIFGAPEPKTSSPKEGRSLLHTADTKRNTQPEHSLRSVNEMERYLQSLHLGETDGPDVIQSDSQGFVVSQDPDASFVSEVLSDSPPPLPIRTTYENSRSTSHVQEQTSFMDHFFTNPSAQFPVGIHGYLVNQMSKSLANPNASVENPASERHVFQSMANERQAFQSTANERQAFQSMANESQAFQNIANERQSFQSTANERQAFQSTANERQAFQNVVSMPNPAVMIRPPQQQSRPVKGGGQSGFSACPPSPKKGRHRVRHQSAEDDPRWQVEPEHDEINATDAAPYTNSPHSSAHHSPQNSPRHLSRHGMSPPVKQTRHSQEVENHADVLVTDGGEDVADVVRLDKDYNDISQRVAEHESRQEELQHYIKMLLDRPPAAEQNLPAGSEILESSQEATSELDLNDTAQAALLNRELKRIQELRERLNPAADGTRPEREKPKSTQHGSQMHGVLPPEQLSEISRLLDEYRTRWEASPGLQVDDSVTQLLDLLQNLPNRHVTSAAEQRHTFVPLSPKSKSRVQIIGAKKPVAVKQPSQPAVSRAAADTSRRSESESEKSYPVPGTRKMERKMTKTSQKSRHSAWK
ncbi:uncharacterized protein LOC121371936 [Gigantopelta aegis]|uniref:uncharacterized protein LOC121371936 n=1 Tax=Gigantopelta aegis TaxID=1735272 RepID=UPI001B8886C7|nr:uncharacterized protein LOC121371936 [Gigantopelta aegis]